MNHYPHHIGDFNNATRHLTRVERSLYRDMIELYYDTEQPLNSDVNRIARRVLAHTEEEVQALRSVLEEFFTMEDDGWHNKRCDTEIAKYRGQIEQASRAGKASAARRANAKATPVERTLNDRATNQNQNQNQEEERAPQASPAGKADRHSRQTTLKNYLDQCRQEGKKPIPDDHYIRRYCQDAGISADMVALAWLRFREEHTTGARKTKRYTEWPDTFANSVKDRWYRLWTIPADGDAMWTSEGLQARRVEDARRQREEEEAHEPA